MGYSASFPYDRLRQSAAAFRTFDFHVRAQAIADKLIPPVVASLRRSAPVGQHYKYPNTEPTVGGALQKSFYGITTWKGASRVVVQWKSNAKYAGYVLHGTKPHQIPPGEKGFLFWYSKQKSSWMKYTKAVNHPGTKPNHYTLGAQAYVRDVLGTEWRKQMGAL